MRSRNPVRMGYGFVMAANAVVWHLGVFRWGMKLAVSLADRALAMVEGVPQPKALSKIYRYSGYVVMQACQFDRGVALIEQSIKLADQVDDFYGMLEAKPYLAVSLYYPGDFARMLQVAQEGLQLASLGADRYFVATCALLVAIARVTQGFPEEAEEQFASVEKLVQQINNALLDYLAGACKGLICLGHKQWVQAAEEFKKVQSIPPGVFFQSEIVFHRCDAMLQAGQATLVKKILRQWSGKVAHIPRQHSRCLALKAVMLFQEGQLERAQGLIQQSVELAKSCGARALQGKSQMLAGRISNNQALYGEGESLLQECQDLLAIRLVSQTQ